MSTTDTPLAPATPGDPSDVRPGPASPAPRETAAARAASGAELTDVESADALDWLLSDTPLEEDIPTKSVQLNVNTAEDPHWIDWTVQAVEENEMRSIRRRASGANRGQRRQGGEFDQDAFNLMVVAAGTRHPNLVDFARRKGIADPATALRQRFARKWGLITILAGEIIVLSGMDDDAVRDAKEVRVAGNS